MPKISSVEPQKKHPHRFNIYLDGQFAFVANEDLVVEYRLIVGKEISKQDLEKLMFEAEVGKLMERMYRLFTIRLRSEKEIRDYLRELSFKRKVKGKEEISDMETDLLIKKLKAKGLINDLEFAKAWVEARRKSKKKGVIALKTELLHKGIDREILDQVINEELADEGDESLATQALEKMIDRWKSLSLLGLKKKAYEYLSRRGFKYAVIKEAVEKIFKKQ